MKKVNKFKVFISSLALTSLTALVTAVTISCVNKNPETDKTPVKNPETTPKVEMDSFLTQGLKPTYAASDYYDSLKDKSGESLLNALITLQEEKTKNLPANKTISQVVTWDKVAKIFVDKYYEKDNTLLDIYSENPTGSDPYEYPLNFKDHSTGGSEGLGFNREHTIPQSWFNRQAPLVYDFNMVWPTDIEVNKDRANYPYGEVVTVIKTFRNGSKLGKDKNGNTVFEPIDAFKGDIARIYLYTVVSYSKLTKTVDKEKNGIKVFREDNVYPFFTEDYLKLMVKWSKSDPVDKFDVDINNTTYEVNGNAIRNPFIDYPSLANLFIEANKDKVSIDVQGILKELN
ncbi:MULTISPECIES: endonuclease [unclassified Mycoplasma]